ALRRGKCVNDATFRPGAMVLRQIDLERHAETFAQRLGNLPDMRDLFHRRTDKRGQAFPPWLPNDPQPTTKQPCCVHYRVIRERGTDFCQPMIKSEIMGNDSGECMRPGCRPWRPAKC